MSADSHDNVPKDGDFAAYLERKSKVQEGARPTQSHDAARASVEDTPSEPPPGSTIEGVLLRNEEPTEELLEAIASGEMPPEIDEDELARQALEHPGEDGDPSTPE